MTLAYMDLAFVAAAVGIILAVAWRLFYKVPKKKKVNEKE